jgi:hypothetical protein
MKLILPLFISSMRMPVHLPPTCCNILKMLAYSIQAKMRAALLSRCWSRPYDFRQLMEACCPARSHRVPPASALDLISSIRDSHRACERGTQAPSSPISTVWGGLMQTDTSVKAQT